MLYGNSWPMKYNMHAKTKIEFDRLLTDAYDIIQNLKN